MAFSIVRINKRLLVCFGLYVAFLFGFAYLYRGAFNSNHGNFLFNVDIRQGPSIPLQVVQRP
jgi:hypothetical protein